MMTKRFFNVGAWRAESFRIWFLGSLLRTKKPGFPNVAHALDGSDMIAEMASNVAREPNAPH
eukprot:872397-Pyramimonas_sp.AAC.1